MKPYLQLGDDPQTQTTKSLTIVWHTDTTPAKWTVRYKTASRGAVEVDGTKTRVAMPGTPAHWVWSATISGLKSGESVTYSLLSGPKQVFTGSTHAPKETGESTRFVVYGDTGRDTKGQRQVAKGIFGVNADYAVVVGDIVYPNGRISDYRKCWFPIMNGDTPLLSSLLHVGVTGNHDTAYRDLTKYPDGLAYYAYWKQPAGGPDINVKTSGPNESRKALFEAAGRRLNSRANFSFAQGDAYWIVLDSNTYANWKTPELRSWLETELKRAQKYTWKFVTFHHPPFHSSKKHAEDNMMRSSTDLFNRYGVDIVFCGHVHNYQRSYPLDTKGKRTTGKGVVYVVTGAGGAELYDQTRADKHSIWKPWTEVYKAGYSFTLVELNHRRLTLQQVGAKGETLDRFTIQK